MSECKRCNELENGIRAIIRCGMLRDEIYSVPIDWARNGVPKVLRELGLNLEIPRMMHEADH